MQQTKLPFTWQCLYDWYASRHYQPAEAYAQADKLWKAVAPLILAEMTDAEVELFALELAAFHGEYQGQPDITDRDFPRCLFTRLNLIAQRKHFAARHQAPEYRLMDQHHMVALYVHEYNGEWHWEVIHESLVDAFGREKTEGAAWAKAEGQWEISRRRLAQKGAQS